MEPGIAILLCVVALVLGAGVSGFICFKQGISYRKKTAEAAVGSAEKEAERIVDDAKKNAETLKSRRKTRSTSHARKRKKSLKREGSKFPDRKDVFSRKRSLSTESSIIWRKRKKLSRTS